MNFTCLLSDKKRHMYPNGPLWGPHKHRHFNILKNPKILIRASKRLKEMKTSLSTTMKWEISCIQAQQHPVNAPTLRPLLSGLPDLPQDHLGPLAGASWKKPMIVSTAIRAQKMGTDQC